MENGVNWKNVVGLEIGGDHKNKSRNILVLEEPFLGGVPRAFLKMVGNQVELIKKGSPMIHHAIEFRILPILSCSSTKN